MNNYTAIVNDNDVMSLSSKLEELGLKEQGVKSEYEISRFRGDNVNVTFYKSGKVLLQGKGTQNLKEELFGVDDRGEFSPRIGSDEVGKGDYFGPMVVVACYVDEDTVEVLRRLGVDDSKKLSDSKIVDIAEQITKVLEYEKRVFLPAEYNELIEQHKNVAIVLARGHAEVLKNLSARIKDNKKMLSKIVVDQFSKSKARLLNELEEETKQIEIEQKHHGESDIAVAAASIIARWIFLDEWKKMEDHYDFSFPRGASSVIDQARIFVDEHGAERLSEVAKVSFRTTQKVLEKELF